MRRNYSLRSFDFTWAFVLIVFLAVAAFMYVLPLAVHKGPEVVITSVLLALFPVVVIVQVIRWIDQWEPEPRAMYILAFGWGAGVAAFAALLGNPVIEKELQWLSQNFSLSGTMIQYVVSAPIVEEITKGIGILVILKYFRSYFNGPVDGLVYGMLIGLGFAFTENILYFSMYFDDITQIFQGRALENPFVHPIATAVTGLGVGWAYEMRAERMQYLPYLGFAGAMLLHALHNYSAIMNMSSGVRFFFQIPVYATGFCVVKYVREREKHEVVSGLTDYLEAGWITQSEFEMIQVMPTRRNAQSWAYSMAEQRGEDPQTGRVAMQRFQEELIQLGYARSRALRSGSVNSTENRKSESERLEQLAFLRDIFTGERSL